MHCPEGQLEATHSPPVKSYPLWHVPQTFCEEQVVQLEIWQGTQVAPSSTYPEMQVAQAVEEVEQVAHGEIQVPVPNVQWVEL